jgi:curved DNA-binding protein CbpA
MSIEQNLYEVIRLPQDASQDRIEEQCIRLGELYRPENNSSDLRAAQIFARIENAYETLRDPIKRAAYDADLLGQTAKSIEIKSTGRSVAIVVSGLAILLTLGYALGYRPYIAQREEAIRIAAEETRRVAEKKARALEAQVRAAEERARITEAQARAAEDRARQAEAKTRADQFETQRQSALARLADAEDLARIANLRAQCDATGAAVNRSSNWAGSFVGAQFGIVYCTQYEQAVKNRQRYEAMRGVDPAVAAKELQAQRDRRLSNRPVVTNCTAWAPGNATCISR